MDVQRTDSAWFFQLLDLFCLDNNRFQRSHTMGAVLTKRHLRLRPYARMHSTSGSSLQTSRRPERRSETWACTNGPPSRQALSLTTDIPRTALHGTQLPSCIEQGEVLLRFFRAVTVGGFEELVEAEYQACGRTLSHITSPLEETIAYMDRDAAIRKRKQDGA